MRAEPITPVRLLKLRAEGAVEAGRQMMLAKYQLAAILSKLQGAAVTKPSSGYSTGDIVLLRQGVKAPPEFHYAAALTVDRAERDGARVESPRGSLSWFQYEELEPYDLRVGDIVRIKVTAYGAGGSGIQMRNQVCEVIPPSATEQIGSRFTSAYPYFVRATDRPHLWWAFSREELEFTRRPQ